MRYSLENGNYKRDFNQKSIVFILQLSNFLVSVQSKFTITSSGIKYVDKINDVASKYGSVVNDKLAQVSSNFFEYIGAEHGRESESGSRAMFAALLLLLIFHQRDDLLELFFSLKYTIFHYELFFLDV